MKPIQHFCLCTAVSLSLFAAPAAANTLNVTATAPGTQVVSSSAGLESAFVATLGYGYALPFADRMLVVGADVTLPWADPDVGDFKLRGNALVPILGHGAWRLLGELSPIVRGSKNEISRMTNLGFDTSVVGGYYGRRWFAAAEFGVDWAVLTRVDHTERYRDLVYDDAQSGWYRSTGANVRAGLFGGYSFDSVDVVLRAGQQRDQEFENVMLPAYVTVGVNVRLPH